jgi:hypothetical protein
MQKYIKHLIAVILFAVVAILYFNPILKGKKIFQSDIVQSVGMGKEIVDFRAANNGEETYWTNHAFGGMPTYQLGARFPNDYISALDKALRFFPRPADYMFLAFISFYILLLVLKVDYRLGVLGALSFGLSTYFIIILGVGHNAKMHAVAYFPLILAGIFLAFQKRYVLGFVLTALAMGLEIHANHFQMTYYLLFAVLILGITYLYQAIKEKTLVTFAKTVGILMLAVVFGIAMNATKLLTTVEYKAFSTRSDSELSIDAQGDSVKVQKGLSRDYITEYSYGKLETMNLFIPRFMGGANHERLDESSNLYKFVKPVMRTRGEALDFVRHSPTYWGKQPIVAGPAYIGAIIIFLFVFSLFLYKGKYKTWIVSTSTLILLLSWGKNFSFLTDLFIDYVPMYNIFRAVSSIQVILELLIPLMAILGLAYLVKNKANLDKKQIIKALYYSTGITAGLALFFALFGTSIFDFGGMNDRFYNQFLSPLIEDRKSIFKADSFRSFLLVIAASGVIWLYIKDKLSVNLMTIALAILLLIDLVGVGRRYVDETNFERASKIDRPFQMQKADLQIKKDKGYFRMLDFQGAINSGRASYFHQTIGGYHAAKPRRFQELYNFYIGSKQKNMQVLNMLNLKYFVDDSGDVIANQDVNGAAWFVNQVKFAKNANEEILALKDFNSKKEAIVNAKYKTALQAVSQVNDSTSSIKIISYQPNHLVYESTSSKTQFAVFSEMYYKNGWQANIDGQASAIYPTNYILRGLKIPAGKHKIEFTFEPQIVQTGSKITLASTLLFALVSLGLLYMDKKKKD